MTTLATMLLAALMVLVPGAAQACACGAFVSGEDAEVQVQREVAAISWDGQIERIVLSLSALSNSGEAALLVPTPAPAQVALADDGLFEALEEVIAPEVEVDYYWWPRSDEGDGSATSGSDVVVLEQVDLGPVEASVLSASDPDELARWLAEHEYVMDDALAAAVAPYVSEGWYYVAVRMTADQSLSGQLPPLDITFNSSSVVYPMRMSAAATTPQHVRTYVFADQRMTRADASAQSTTVNLRYAGSPDPAAVTNGTLTELLEAGPYLTVVDQSFYSPGAQVVSDFVFERSSNGGDHREVVVEERLLLVAGLPAGPLALGAGLFVLVVGGLGLVWWRRRSANPAPQRAPNCPAETPAPVET